jgi:hypothetical protein
VSVVVVPGSLSVCVTVRVVVAVCVTVVVPPLWQMGMARDSVKKLGTRIPFEA